MGWDMFIAAKSAKVLYYYDRYYNFMCFDLEDTDPKYAMLLGKCREGLSASEVEYICTSNKPYLAEHEPGHEGWPDAIMKFVNFLPPNETFFVVDWDDGYELLDKHGYRDVSDEVDSL